MVQKVEVLTGTYIRSLMILHLALVSGQVIFVLVSLFLNITHAMAPISFSPEVRGSLLYIAPAIAAGGVAAGWFLFKQRITNLKLLPPSTEKYAGYRSASLLRYAAMEAPSLVATMLFLLSGNYYYLIIAGAVILTFIIVRPSAAMLIRHLQPSFEEQMALEQPDAVLYEDDRVLG
ncbi:hypothetical protein [Taibaiella koreensis]|uniref:hypothetical protein n=1 Tax=Taibaiella koreensis TaxID=1268548 RepID=UPI000E599282|nr:hypothetical protein [Taibaiella koreensis]